jgi:hypothetical protein
MFQPSAMSLYRYGAAAELYTDNSAALENGKKKKKKKRAKKAQTSSEPIIETGAEGDPGPTAPQEDNSLSLMFYVFGVGTIIVGGGVAAYYTYKKKQQAQAEQDEGEE